MVAAVPGMVVETGPRPLPHAVWRGGSNLWWAAVGGLAVPAALAEAARDCRLPSEVLARAAAAGLRGSTTVARLELDVCGAWVTVANAGSGRPVVVRRAGWVDLRGHPAPPLATGWQGPDDRIGLGPADLILLRDAPAEAGEGDASDDDRLFDHALRVAGADPTGLMGALAEEAHAPACLALGVPGSLGDVPAERVSAATGIPAEQVEGLGYPLGDHQPDLWSEPPPPPRLARLRLTRDRSGIPRVRSLLDRLLSSWRLDGRVEEADLKLIATELATNAVVHADFPDTITIRYLGGVIRVEVRDTSPAEPVPRSPSSTRESGRGMHLVEVLASSWGVTPRTLGKEVWCEVPVS